MRVGNKCTRAPGSSECLSLCLSLITSIESAIERWTLVKRREVIGKNKFDDSPSHEFDS